METTKILLIKNLKRLRKERGWSQEKLAEKSGISISFLKDIERGESLGTANTIDQLSDAFDIEVHELFIDREKHEDPMDLIRQIASLGPTELGILKENLKALSKPISSRKVSREG